MSAGILVCSSDVLYEFLTFLRSVFKYPSHPLHIGRRISDTEEQMRNFATQHCDLMIERGRNVRKNFF